MTASATVDGDSIQMEASNESTTAMVPMTVINTRGPELPKTGDNGVWRYGVFGLLLMAFAAAVIFLAAKNRKAPKSNR